MGIEKGNQVRSSFYHTSLVKKMMTEQPARRLAVPRLTRHLAHWRDTDRAYAHNREGWGYLQQGQYLRALNYFNDALALAPDYEKALLGRGRVYFSLQYYEQARADFVQALRGNRRAHEAQFWLGQALFVLRDYQEALAAYNRAIHLKPRNAAAYNGRGEVSFHLQDYHAALASFDHALGLDSKFALAYTNRGLTYCKLKQYKKAQRDFRLAISLDPAQRRAYTGSGQAAFALRDYARARNFYQQALLIIPTCQVYNNLGMVFDALGERTQAIEAYNRAIELDPGHWVPYNNRGWSCYAVRDTAAALANFEQAIMLSPLEACEAYLNRAWILAEHGRYDLALEECNHVLLWGIRDALAYAYRARVHFWQGNELQALADCEQALRLDNDLAEAHGVLALLAHRQQRLTSARDSIEKARKFGHDLFWLDERETTFARPQLEPNSVPG